MQYLIKNAMDFGFAKRGQIEDRKRADAAEAEVERLRKTVQDLQESEGGVARPRRVCRFFGSDRGCRKGSRCDFEHETKARRHRVERRREGADRRRSRSPTRERRTSARTAPGDTRRDHPTPRASDEPLPGMLNDLGRGHTSAEDSPSSSPSPSPSSSSSSSSSSSDTD